MNIEELRSLEAVATAAPWHEWHGDDRHAMNCTGITSEPCAHEMVDEEGHAQHTIALTLLQEPRYASLGVKPDYSDWLWDENAALIVALRNAAPGLLRLLEDARKEISDMAADAHAAEHNHLTDFMECMTATCQLRVALLARFEEVRS